MSHSGHKADRPAGGAGPAANGRALTASAPRYSPRGPADPAFLAQLIAQRTAPGRLGVARAGARDIHDAYRQPENAAPTPGLLLDIDA